MSARLGPLEEAGLISRTHQSGDRRRVRVRLTEAGNAVFEQHVASEEAGDVALLAALSAAERQTLAELLRKLVVAAESGPDAAVPASSAPKRSRSAGS
ncbi:MarR family winged helix-turn-helix transcriptional regulator [Streptomyces fulvoviolaceus]|uniref:MarR family winged helix-turn-helix transcriptional regulator n=1 Tax=Streptomyces fulvoviolaceus TaxID=285535 RepID=UPI000A5D1776|nr:winged helix DNA-binding protein [Streptomyces fulvoviolaceus]MCT9077993.1 winged helix DNA-binding protein [Streptomyces fulvoviolaceus]